MAKSAERKVRENNWCVLTKFKMVFGTAERNINSVFTMGKNTHKNENKDVKWCILTLFKVYQYLNKKSGN